MSIPSMPGPESNGLGHIQPPVEMVPQEGVHPLTTILRFLQALKRRKWIVMLWLMVTVGLGAAYFATATRKYQSSAELLILHSGEGSVDETQQSQKTLQDHIPTYTKVMASEEVLKGALQNLPPKYQAYFLGKSVAEALGSIRNNLSVQSTRQTNLLQVKYTSADPDFSAVMITEILKSYFLFMQDMHKSSSQETLNLLTTERDQIEKEIESNQDNLLRLRAESTSLLGTGDNVISVVNERVIELNRTLAAAQKETTEARTFYYSVEQAVRNGEDLQQYIGQSNQVLAGELMKMGVGVDSQDKYTLSRIQQQLMEDETELDNKLNNELGPNHPEVVSLQQRIKSAKVWLNGRSQDAMQGSTRINHELGPRLLVMAKQRYQQAVTHEKEIHQRFQQEQQLASEMNQRLVLLQLAERNLDRLQNDYDMIRERINTVDLNQQSSLKTRITKQAKPNKKPVSPKLASTMLMSIFAGLFLGGLTVLVLDLLDDQFRSPDDLKATIGAPILTMIRDLPPLQHTTGIKAIFTHTKPNSVETESFRTLRTAIDFSNESLKVISISSTEPSDGKTTVISNTAVAFAQAGKRTLLIDADMRRPGLSKLFALRGHQGLSAVLQDHVPIAEAVEKNLVNAGLPNLDIIAAGPRPSNPVELLTSNRFSELVSWAESEYDQVLIDAPPSLAVTDPAIIGRLVDGVILTVRPDKNRRRMIIRAADSVKTLGAHMIGMVVNRLQDDGGEYSYGYGYGYGYGEEEIVEMEEAMAAWPENLEQEPEEEVEVKRPRKRFSNRAA